MQNNSIKIHQGKQFEQTIEQAFQAAYKRSPNDDDPDDQEQLRNMQQYFAASDLPTQAGQTDLPLSLLAAQQASAQAGLPARTQQMALEWRLYNITGHTADLDEALDEFENVKQAVGELFDENQALSILNRRMRLTLDFATKAMDIVERDAAMFVTPKARKWIEQFREQYTKLDNAILHSKIITDLPAHLSADRQAQAGKEHNHANATDQPND
jgi:regulator of replication initiation timing